MINKDDKGKIVEVLIDSPHGGFILKGDQGEVMGFDEETGDVAVEFSFEFVDAHSCDGLCTNGWFISPNDLRIIE